MFTRERIIHDLKLNLAEQERDVQSTREAINLLLGNNQSSVKSNGRRRRTMSPDARRRISKMMKKRWAERKRKQALDGRQHRKGLHWTQKKENKAKLKKVLQFASAARKKNRQAA